MDFADGGDLQGKIKGNRGKFFTESQILDWFTQICLGLKHVHDRKILHRDIKAQNVFLTSTNRCLLGDFGIAKILAHTKGFTKTMVGTPYYLSPEIIERKHYNFQSDIWSLGILLYELCALKPPFDGPNLHFLGMKIIKGVYPPISTHYSRELKNLVTQMLMVDPNKRPTIHQILQMSLIQARIKNFLNETQYGSEFSHTILHKVNVLENKENKVGEAEAKDQLARLNPLPGAKVNPYQKQAASPAFVPHPNKDRELERMRLERERLFKLKEAADKKKAEEIEKKRIEEIEKRKQEEIEKKRLEDIEHKKKLEEIERRKIEEAKKRQEEIERKQKESLERKRKEEIEKKKLVEDLERKRSEELKRLQSIERKQQEVQEKKRQEEIEKKKQERREEIIKLFPPNKDSLAFNRPKNNLVSTPISQPLIKQNDKLALLKANFDKQLAIFKEEKKKVEVQSGVKDNDKRKYSHSPSIPLLKAEVAEEAVPETACVKDIEAKKPKKSSKTKVKSKKKSIKKITEPEAMAVIPEEDEAQKEINNYNLMRKEMRALIDAKTPKEDIIEDCIVLAQQNNESDKDRDDMKGELEEEAPIFTPQGHQDYSHTEVIEQKTVDDKSLVREHLEERFGKEKVERIVEKLMVYIKVNTIEYKFKYDRCRCIFQRDREVHNQTRL
jgi:NIMA (never in mitosis gene a)-related kinase